MYLSSAAPLCKSPSAQHATSPRHGRTKFGRWEFYVACPTAWNSLPDYLCDPSLSEDIIGDIPVCVALVHEAHQRHGGMRSVNFLLTYLLIYKIVMFWRMDGEAVKGLKGLIESGRMT